MTSMRYGVAGDAYQDETRDGERQEAEYGRSEPVRLIARLRVEELHVGGDEGGGECPFAEEVLQQVRDAERGPEDVCRVGGSEVVG